MEKITINYVFQRFGKMEKDYTGNTSVLVSVFYFIDWLLAWVLYGASISDYLAFTKCVPMVEMNISLIVDIIN